MTMTIRDLIGADTEDKYLDFDLSEVQQVLATLQIETAVDLPQAENMQRMALRAADVLSEYSGKLTKMIGVIESKLNRKHNEIQLNYEAPTAKGKTTADMRKSAAEADPEVEKLSIELAKVKGAMSAVNKKYDLVIKTHHYYKDIALGFKRTLMNNPPLSSSSEGWN